MALDEVLNNVDSGDSDGKSVVVAVPVDFKEKAKRGMGKKMVSLDMERAKARGDSSSPAAEWLRAKQMYIFYASICGLLVWLAFLMYFTLDVSVHCSICLKSVCKDRSEFKDKSSCEAQEGGYWGRRKNQEWFWIGLGLKNFILFLIQAVMGLGVYLKNWNTGYTHRPEDKGYTQLFTLVQVPLSIVIIAAFQVLFHEYKEAWTICPIIAVTFGDGLAEPVAVYWSRNKVCGGTHTYQTRGMCTTRKFTRSIEGSATVFLWTVIAIFFIYSELSGAELGFLLVVLPISMSVLEAYAPHSLDNPFLLGWGYFCLILAHYFGDWVE